MPLERIGGLLVYLIEDKVKEKDAIRLVIKKPYHL